MSGRLANHIVWSGLGFCVNKGSLFYAIILASHYLSTGGYVHYSLFLLAVNIFSGILGGSLSLMANRYAYRKKLVFGLWLMIALFSVGSGLIYFVYASLNQTFSVQLPGVRLIESGYVVGMTYLTAMNGIYYGQNKFKSYALINVMIGISTILLITPVVFRADYFWFVFAALVPLAIFFLGSSFQFLANRNQSVFSWRWIKNGLNKVFFPNLFSGILFQPAILFSAEFVLKYSEERDLIAFSVANQFRMILTSFSIILGSVLISRLLLSRDRAGSNRKNIELSYYPLLILTSFLMLILKWLFVLFDKMDYDAFKVNTAILCGVVIIGGINSAISRNFVIDEKGTIGVWNNLTWLLVFIGLNFCLVPIWGSTGASASFLLASFVQFLVWLPYCIRHNYFSLSFFNPTCFLTGFLFLLILVSEFYFRQSLLSVLFFILLVLGTYRYFRLQINRGKE